MFRIVLAQGKGCINVDPKYWGDDGRGGSIGITRRILATKFLISSAFSLCGEIIQETGFPIAQVH